MQGTVAVTPENERAGKNVNSINYSVATGLDLKSRPDHEPQHSVVTNYKKEEPSPI
ncbi:hypothetical protein ACRALDRAFT_2015301 [Sodiomyces alcalophilus JCM 7366]|uniref:uncharacterized protein n=1 Tax=Sodiomyces alcalophilus JCM 7366 TaxID=591952 RepID=UPI0039B37D90